MQLASAQCMHYLHGYYEVYPPSTAQDSNPVRQGLLLTAILSMTLKVLTHDYVIEYLPIRDQLKFFDVDVETEELRLQQLYKQAALAQVQQT